jgi:hypothetical protein
MTTASIACPKCRNDLWDICGDTAECTNCGYERPFSYRKSKTGNPTQLAKIEAIKNHFSREAKGELVTWRVTMQEETGFAYVSVDTSNNPYLNQGGSFTVGPRGKVRCFLVHNLGEDKDYWKRSWERRFAR